MSPNLTMMAEEFGFNDEERDRYLGGYVALAFFTLGCPISFMVGYCADKYPRIPLFALIIVLGEGACFFTYWTTTYEQLLITRALTGISVGGALPLIFSLLSDMFGSDKRNLVSALVGGGMGFGIAFGQLLAGFIGPAHGWRLPFVIVSIPAFICAALMVTTLTEPPRGCQESSVRELSKPDESKSKKSGGCFGVCGSSESNDFEERSSGGGEVAPEQAVGLVMEKTLESGPDVQYKPMLDSWGTFKLLFANKTAVLLFVQGIPGCLPWGLVAVFMSDYLSDDCGLSVESATIVVSMFGIGAFLGLLFGGGFGQYLYNRNKKQLVLFFAEQRGTAFALLNTTDDIGKGAGPFLISVFVTAFGDRKAAFNFVTMGWILGGMVNAFIYFTIVEDEDKCQEIVRKTIALSIEMTNMESGKVTENLTLITSTKE
ncbi:hypothetical protein TrCOL_g9824 [Triparma columacea]|uniref:Major facilitator superfamily (MFS) profile domain-containing protein n=1 Tax=Triparma columacea TaxID=722753 RepID=A0A9W7LBE1_9STRA|nr:hypothetical protein TrCOL_g9824 [Triparma columacea]